MALVSRLSCLLALLIIAILAELEVHFIRKKGNSITLKFRLLNGFCVISKDTPEGSLLLWNTSNPSPENATGPDDVRSRIQLKRFNFHQYFTIENLSNSDSGLYRRECWDLRMTKAYQKNFPLTVCGIDQPYVVQNVLSSSSVELECQGAGAGPNMTIQWYRWSPKPRGTWIRMFSEENGSLNPVMKDLEGRVQMVENSSSLHIADLTSDEMSSYNCLVFDRQKCLSSQRIILQVKRQYVYHTEGERAVLTCFDNTNFNGTSVFWHTPDDMITPYESRESSHVIEQRQQMYVADKRTREGKENSLVIPSLKLNHSGHYECRTQYNQDYLLLVCPESEPLAQFLSIGDGVTLRCLSNLSSQDSVVWFRRTTQHHGIILHSASETEKLSDHVEEMAKLPDDLEERVNMSTPYTMLLSNFSLQDSGEYWCAVVYRSDDNYSKYVCKSVTRVILLYHEPFGIYSNFYRAWASLMSCGLLGMICAVATVNLKTRS